MINRIQLIKTRMIWIQLLCKMLENFNCTNCELDILKLMYMIVFNKFNLYNLIFFIFDFIKIKYNYKKISNKWMFPKIHKTKKYIWKLKVKWYKSKYLQKANNNYFMINVHIKYLLAYNITTQYFSKCSNIKQPTKSHISPTNTSCADI